MITKLLPILIGSCVLGLAFSLLLTFAVNEDARARSIKSRKVYSILTFFFGPIVAIVYACTRKKAERLPDPEPQPQKHVKRSMICFILAIVVYVANIGLGAYLGANGAMEGLFGESGFFDFEMPDTYDMKGNLVDKEDTVPLYDRDDNAYVYEYREMDEETFEDMSVYINQTTKEEYRADLSYVDADGYFFYDENDEVELNDDAQYIDKNGNECYSAGSVYWDADGVMHEYGEAFSDFLELDEDAEIDE